MAIEIKVNRMYRFNDEGKRIKAIADIEVAGLLLVKGIQVMNGKNGLFVSMPRQKGKDNKWYETVRTLTDQVKETISSAVLTVYEAPEAVS
jgi:stage V sporulation protein G